MKHLVQFVYVLCLYRNLRPFSLQLTHYEARIGDDARVGDTKLFRGTGRTYR